jgi:AcrR family transcriptional regulator
MYKICHTEESSRRQRELEQGFLELLRSQSYDKLTLTELCRRLNVPRKSFYRYFPTKEDCLLALIDHTLADCNDIALMGWDGSTALDEQVEYFVAHGLMTTVLRWHRFGFQSTPEEMAKVFGRLLASTDASMARLLL